MCWFFITGTPKGSPKVVLWRSQNNLVQMVLGWPSVKAEQIILIGWKTSTPGSVASFSYIYIYREKFKKKTTCLKVQGLDPWYSVWWPLPNLFKLWRWGQKWPNPGVNQFMNPSTNSVPRPDLDPICWHSNGILERFFQNSWFWKNQQTTRKHEKFPKGRWVKEYGKLMTHQQLFHEWFSREIMPWRPVIPVNEAIVV